MMREEEFTAAAITLGEERSDRIFEHLLREILSELHQIHRILEPKFTLHIQQIGESTLRDSITYWRTDMAAITAGQSGTFLLSATASDNSTPVLSAQTLTADDSNVQIAQDATDPNSFTVTVTVPASDTQTTFNLSASASVTSNTSSTPQTVTATLPVTISPAAVPVTFQLSISEK